MKPWAYILVAVLPFGGLILLACWLRQRAQQVDTTIDTLIVPPVPKFAGHDDALRLRTIERRRAADAIRTRAAHVESGAPVSDVLRLVAK